MRKNAVNQITTELLREDLWADLEKLFSCADDWRIFLSPEVGSAFLDDAKQVHRVAASSGRILGVLAYAGGEPVGYCSHEPHGFPPSRWLREGVGCVPTFFVKPGPWEIPARRALLTEVLQRLAVSPEGAAEVEPPAPPSFDWPANASGA